MFKTKRAKLDPIPAGKSSSSLDVARIAGVSLRQLQWWDEKKVVSPRHEGHRRIYAPAEVVEIAIIAELRRKGFSLQKIRRVLRYLQKEMGKRVEQLLSGGSDFNLLTDGKAIYLEDSESRVIDILKNARQPFFLVCVTDHVKRLHLAHRKPAKSETAVVAAKTKAV
jgi:DNA-binding transcriptional MerR regulator